MFAQNMLLNMAWYFKLVLKRDICNVYIKYTA